MTEIKPVRLAVLWHSSEMYFHYRSVLKHLNPAEFEIVMTVPEREMVDLIKKENYQFALLPDVLNQQKKYPYTLSNHFISARKTPQGGTQYLPQVLGQKHIRLMYALGKDYWNYASWNQLYDVHLCFGPWQKQRLLGFDSHVFEVGYPRYDDFFNLKHSQKVLKEQMGLSLDKPVWVWLPTRNEHAIEWFAPVLASLQNEAQILVKPHPFTLKEEPQLLQTLREQFEIVIDFPVDNQWLYAIADWVLCDLGGPPFGAIYTQTPLLLLDDGESLAVAKSNDFASELYLREQLTCWSRQNLVDSHRNLHETSFKQACLAKQDTLFPQFFAQTRGVSGEKAAFILNNLERILGDDT